MRANKKRAEWQIGLLVAVSLVLSAISWSQTQTVPATVPLIQALHKGDLVLARRILDSGANPDVFDSHGETPLNAAIRGGFTAFAGALLSMGADPKFTGPSGETPLMTAARYCDLEVADVLLKRVAQVNAVDAKGETPLMLAAQTCPDVKMIELLMGAHADAALKDKSGHTAEDYGCAPGKKDSAEVCAALRRKK
jgi:uncharacterized protein